MIDSVWKFLIAYGLLVNLCGFMLCGLDKRRAVKNSGGCRKGGFSFWHF